MHINVHLQKEEISQALKEYVEQRGFLVEDKSMITMRVDKGNEREQEMWDAVIVGCGTKGQI